MKFVDFKCNKCGNISEYVINNCDAEVICVNCGSKDTVRIFSPVGFKSSSSNGFSTNNASKSCSGGSCSSCSGCR